MKRVLMIAIVATVIIGCGREIECRDASINLNFIGFSPNSLNNLVIRKFIKNSNFQNKIDSILVMPPNILTNNLGDTSMLALGNSGNYPTSEFDYQIFLPAINRTILLTDIQKRDRTSSCGALETDCFCDDEIISLKVDNQIGILQNTRAYNLFIR